jgi:predicted metal-dependent peptidase
MEETNKEEKEQNNEKVINISVPNNEYQKELNKAIFDLLMLQPFYGYLLQEISIKSNYGIPTASLLLEPLTQSFKILINPYFFCKVLKEKERIGVLFHEVLHFTHAHLININNTYKNKDERILMNLAQDIAINQYINSAYLPENCLLPEKFKDKDDNPFPQFKTWEFYYDLLKELPKEKQEELIKRFKTIDEHEYIDFDKLSEEQKKEVLKKMKDLLKRTVEKTGYGYNLVPSYVQNLIKELDVKISSINYKALLTKAIKKTLCKLDYEKTRTRPSRRYKDLAPGNKIEDVPKLSLYIDTSGSISWTELNLFLKFVNRITLLNQVDFNLNLWSDTLYFSSKIKYNDIKNLMDIVEKNMRIGGTDIDDLIEKINKDNSDLHIVLTDGYYSIHKKLLKKNVIFGIYNEGELEHPLYKDVLTIPLNKI